MDQVCFCDHLSRENDPLVKMSAMCVDVLKYLIWNPESQYIRSNDQSKFARWVREICLLDGLRPSVIFLITASLSSQTSKDARWLEMCEFEGTSVNLLSVMKDIVLGLLLSIGFLPAGGSNASTTMSHQLSAGIHSNKRPTSNEIISASVRLCDTAYWYECAASQNAQHAS